jgi:hypothetical protein
MNRTQKGMWIILFSALLGAVTFSYVGSIFVFGRMPPSPFGRIGPVFAVLIPLLIIGLTLLFIARRQSPAEPEADERDKTIMRNAVLVSFVTAWLLLALVVLILGITLGQTGSIPVYVLTIILFGVFLMAELAYSVAILAQYGRGDTNEQ